MFAGRFHRTADGQIRLRLPPHERGILRELARTMRAEIADNADDPALRRLFPPASTTRSSTGNTSSSHAPN
jgi:hypothetical protein